MINVQIDEADLLDMLDERVEFWTDDAMTKALFHKMYENYIEGELFSGGPFDTKEIVDNDYINNCNVVEEGDEYYDAIKKHFEEEGLGDCSCDHDCGYSYIEAEEDGTFLCRW